MGADFVWQWEGDQENDWIPYPAATCLDLQVAKNGHREPIVDLTVGRTRYKLDTVRMVQTNQQTKFERRMECRQSGIGVPKFILMLGIELWNFGWALSLLASGNLRA